ncbi:hypothetical protein N7451_012906 [Penicillium sp. IBT 35674x]|nr:hypothetical protein N7451_012906 [Penicillium sp. IBT 35674x]
MRDVFISPFEDMYIVTECLMTDLRQLLQSISKPMEVAFAQSFTYQILVCFHNVIVRRPKLINLARSKVHTFGWCSSSRLQAKQHILINDNCDLKICDFGLAREHNHQMTGYVTTRYYGAPEVMLIWQTYTSAVGLWIVGCIVAEMILGRILFPGQNHIHQFTLVSDLLGKPPKSHLKKHWSTLNRCRSRKPARL